LYIIVILWLSKEGKGDKMTLSSLLKRHIENNIYETEQYLGKKFHRSTGDNCEGDIIWFARDCFSGSFKNAKFDGTECLRVVILKDSYGKEKQQHTFTCALMKSASSKTHVKGSEFKIDRGETLNNKHTRGEQARLKREERREAY
jgi:hypothetical protein